MAAYIAACLANRYCGNGKRLFSRSYKQRYFYILSIKKLTRPGVLDYFSQLQINKTTNETINLK